ncbi:MAG TPA: hypothetical protein VF810_00605 [Patescibacteria group bacterium]
MTKKISGGIIFLLLGALIFRVVIITWSLQFRENTDVIRYKDQARIAYLYGLADTYKPTHLTFGTLPNNQPPGTTYILYGTYLLELQAAKVIFKLTHTSPVNNQWVNGPLVTIFLRLPSILADLILGALIYLFIKNYSSEKKALFGSTLFLFSPPVWYNSAFWGQMDSLNNLMFFIAIFFLSQKKYFWSILFVFLALFIKLSLLPVLPFFFYLLFVKNKYLWKKLVLITLICVVLIFVLTLPISKFNILWIFEFIKNNSVGETPAITNFAFNFWWMLFHPTISLGNPNSLFSFSEVRMNNSPLDSISYFFLPLFLWAIIFFIITSLPILKKIYFLKNNVFEPQNILIIFTLINLLIFILLPRIHDRYLYPLFPLLAALVGLSGKYFKIFIFFSLLNLINLYIAWHPMKLWFFPYEVMNNSNFQWFISFGMVLTGVIFYFKAIKSGFIYGKNK